MYLNTGKLGIGTNTPQTALSVNGSITCKEVVVTMDGWADYVFNPEYSLPSIEQVESFIKTNNHLPDMPSEKDIVNNGLSLADIVKQQMKKIEELTLYVIQLKKENIELSKRIISLENNNE
ncbi:MAG: hypothetical protein ACD_79C00008G0001 [uncultured bacterium]|nr:MAG: hypothetical protein ACD_79C00008G0001 [uncultured bacterium]